MADVSVIAHTMDTMDDIEQGILARTSTPNSSITCGNLTDITLRDSVSITNESSLAITHDSSSIIAHASQGLFSSQVTQPDVTSDHFRTLADDTLVNNDLDTETDANASGDNNNGDNGDNGDTGL